MSKALTSRENSTVIEKEEGLNEKKIAAGTVNVVSYYSFN